MEKTAASSSSLAAVTCFASASSVASASEVKVVVVAVATWGSSAAAFAFLAFFRTLIVSSSCSVSACGTGFKGRETATASTSATSGLLMEKAMDGSSLKGDVTQDS